MKPSLPPVFGDTELVRQAIQVGLDQLNAGQLLDEDEVFNQLEEMIRAIEASNSQKSTEEA